MAEDETTCETGILSREQAKRYGCRSYSGKPCKNAHDGERFVANNKCVECRKAALARHAANHPDRRKEWAARHKSRAETPPKDATRTCRRCGQNKAIVEYRLHEDSGLYEKSCRKCEVCIQLARARTDPDAKKAANARYYEANLDKELARNAVWRRVNKARRQAYVKRRYDADPELMRARAKTSREKSPEAHRAACRAWKRQNPERCISLSHKRRALAAGSGGSHYTHTDVIRILKAQRGRCGCCRVKFGSKFVRDHIKALSKGGSNAAKNIQLLCKRCNSEKHDKDPIDFMRSRGFLL